jgi:hypothetical protein
MGLFGEESKEVEQTLLKVQSAMALANAAQSVGESVDQFKQLGAVVKSYTIVQRISTAVQAAFNAVMAANPIGAVVVAITALIAAGYALVKMFQASSDAAAKSEQAHKSLTKELKTQVEAQKAASIESDLSRDSQLKMAKASGQSAAEIRKLSVELANQEVAQKIANAQTLRAIAIEAIRVAGLEDATEAQKTLAKNALKEFNDANELAKTAVLNRRKLLIDNKAAETQEQTDATKKANEKIEKLQDEATQKKVKKAEDEAAALKAIADKKLADDIKSAQDALNIVNALNESYETPAEKETREYNEKKAILEANNLSTELLTQKHLENLALIVKTDAEKKAAEDEKIAADKKTKDDAAAKEELDREKAIADGKKAIQESYLNVASNGIALLKTVFEKNKGIQKGLILAESAVGLARIVTNTQAANAADRLYAATMGPAGAGYLAAKIPLNYVGAAIGSAANIAATAKALSALGGGGAGSAPSGGSAGGGSAAPQFNVVGNSGVNQLADVMNTQQQTPVKAYVVPSDVTTGQSLDRNIIRNASLG